MYFWQYGLLAFAVLWGLQIAGTAIQMKHYRTTLAAITERWRDGFVGSGSARARFGAGAIAIVVAAPDGSVRQVLLMRGRTVFAKFRKLPELEGVPLDRLRDGTALSADGTRAAGAIRAAVEQIDRIAADQRTTQPAVAVDDEDKTARRLPMMTAA
jgi:glucitol operon activator protein